MNTTQTAAATFAIGTCSWAGHVIRAERKPPQTYTICPDCEPVEMGGWVQRSTVKWATGKGKVTTAECDGACRSAKSLKCSCQCGGRNHGANYDH